MTMAVELSSFFLPFLIILPAVLLNLFRVKEFHNLFHALNLAFLSSLCVIIGIILLLLLKIPTVYGRIYTNSDSILLNSSVIATVLALMTINYTICVFLSFIRTAKIGICTGLISGLSADDLVKNEHGYLDWLGYRSRFGWVSLSPIKSKQKIASYITKYISKDVFSTAEVLKSGSHLYYASQGLNGRAVVADHMRPDSLPKKLAANWDFENDYCKIRWFDSLEDLQKACL